jgi:hypothetical protein
VGYVLPKGPSTRRRSTHAVGVAVEVAHSRDQPSFRRYADGSRYA